MNRIIEQIFYRFQVLGLQGRIVPIRRIWDLQEGIEGCHNQGHIDKDLYEEGLTFFSFLPPDDFPSATSLIVVAVPRPQTRISFIWNGRKLTLTLPPNLRGSHESQPGY